MSEGATFPAMHAMLAKWVPKTEQSRFAAYIYNGANFGTILSIPLSGFLCSLNFMGGWPLSFYIFGFLGYVWCFFWFYLIYDTPQSHPHISLEERFYIEQSLNNDNELSTKVNEPVPWKDIVQSVPLWALLITICGQSFLFYTQLTELPSYMSNVLHFDIQQNAILSSLPYLTSWIFGILCSIFADWLIERGFISQKNSFKLWNTVTSTVPSIGLIAVSWAGCDRIWVMFLLAGFGAFQGAGYAGNSMNHIALSPRFAGTLYGITNSAGNTCGFLAPYIIGSMVSGREGLKSWGQVFNLAASINIAASLVFIMFAQAEEQPWSKRRHRSE